jgi:hypothetical protein
MNSNKHLKVLRNLTLTTYREQPLNLLNMDDSQRVRTILKAMIKSYARDARTLTAAVTYLSTRIGRQGNRHMALRTVVYVDAWRPLLSRQMTVAGTVARILTHGESKPYVDLNDTEDTATSESLVPPHAYPGVS